MDEPELDLQKQDAVEILVKRHGNCGDSTYVGWKTLDGTALNGQNFVGGTGKDLGITQSKILFRIGNFWHTSAFLLTLLVKEVLLDFLLLHYKVKKGLFS